MFEPVRGGTRGGQAEFKWSDVSADKDRENYLGHSINAPTGRWQKNKDVHWYSRDKDADEAERLEEIRKIKEAEAEALAAALGFGSAKPMVPGAGPASGSNGIAVPVAEKKETAEEKEARRELRKAEKRARKEEKRALKSNRRDRHFSEITDHPARDRSRSRSPIRRPEERYQTSRGRRSRSPRGRRYELEERDSRRRDTDRRRRVD